MVYNKNTTINQKTEKVGRNKMDKKFVKGWIHAGGDDKQFAIEVYCETDKEAEEITVKYLKKKRSSVLNDFVIMTKTEFEESERKEEEYIAKLEAQVKAMKVGGEQ